MPADSTIDFIEQGRRIFAGDWQFIWAASSLESLPPMAGMEVAFAGRSNVGKSSLINALTGRNGLARTSHTPGRTQELIFFQGPPNTDLRLVDMPGYGYASASKTKIAAWTDLIHSYLQGRANLGRVYLLIDSRHGFKDVDIDILKTFDRAAVSYQIVLTKADKLKPRDVAQVSAETVRKIAKRPAAFPRVVATSAEKGTGIPELRAEILAACEL